MPLRRLRDLPEPYCKSQYHEPPAHLVLEEGVYEYQCPDCKRHTTFTVRRPRVAV